MLNNFMIMRSVMFKLDKHGLHSRSDQDLFATKLLRSVKLWSLVLLWCVILILNELADCRVFAIILMKINWQSSFLGFILWLGEQNLPSICHG